MKGVNKPPSHPHPVWHTYTHNATIEYVGLHFYAEIGLKCEERL